jgi:glycosyltransferase involved in cell wall biosynthesis
VLPRLGVIGYGPIQYHTPLWQLLTQRGNLELDVLFLSDKGFSPMKDPAFGVSIAWDIDLLSGYTHHFLTTTENPTSRRKRVSTLVRWLPSHDAVVINGYTSPWMLLAMVICRVRGIPYFLRGSSHPKGRSSGFRRYLRALGARLVVSGSAGGLSMGHLNDEFYRQNGARSITFAPNSVDDERFACPPPVSRSDLLAQWGLKDIRPVIVFSGKLIPRKRPLDLVAAIERLPCQVNTLFVGDGLLAERIRTSLPKDSAAVTGFINQSDIPSYYHAADILVLPSEIEAWGLVVNEAMAAGTLPVVSDRVGCVPDLVHDFGEVFRCGDVLDLADALNRALARVREPQIREQVRMHVARYSLQHTAEGFERATQSIGIHRQNG